MIISRQYTNLIKLLILSIMFVYIGSVSANETSQPIVITGGGDHHPLNFKLPNGEPAGFYIDLWKLWSKSNNIPITFEITTMQKSLQLVKNNHAIHLGLFKNEKRALWADFSTPFHQVGASLFYNQSAQNNDIKKKLKDFEGEKVAVLSGSYHEQYLADNYPLIKRISYSAKDSFLQLFNEEIEAIFDETPAMNSVISQLEMTGVFESTEVTFASNLVHAVIAKDQPRLLKKINQGFENIPLNLLLSLEEKWLPKEPKFFREKAPLNTLTLAEHKWLMQFPKFISPIELNAYPYSFRGNNKVDTGAWVDYLTLISQRLNIEIDTVGFDTWSKTLNALMSGESDFILGIAESDERRKHFHFTKPFFSSSSVIVMKKDSFFIESMNGLNGKKLGIIKGYIEAEFVERDFPNIDIVLVDSAPEGMKLVSEGKLDAFIASLDTINRTLSKYNHTKLIIASMTPYKLLLSIAVKKELKALVPILNKVIDSIDEKTRSSIGNNWLSARSSEGTDIRTILYWALPILSFLTIIILVILKINNKLKNEIAQREEIERERKGLESQLIRSQKMEAVGSLAGGMAHDFNNILGIIIGNVELTKMNIHNTEKVKKYNENIYQASDRAQKLVSQIMTFSRMNITSFKPLNLALSVNECISLIKSTSPANIEFVTKISPNENFIINGNETQISQVLINLCTNAIHAMSKEGGRLIVSLAQSPPENTDLSEQRDNNYILTITDAGCGIDEKIINSIFDPFFSTKEVGQGTGLGLSVVHNIIKQHRGDIAVKSTVGKGTIFTVCLPVSKESIEEKQTSNYENKVGNGRILIAEDEECLCMLYKEQLELAGYEVTICANGQEALSEFNKKPTNYDLVLTDHSMPIMSGTELAKKILSIRPNLPIILATGYADLMSMDEMNSIGLSACLIKPVRIDELNQTVHKCLTSSIESYVSPINTT